MAKNKQIKHRNVVPVYAVAAVWILGTFLFRLRGIFGCVLMAVCSFVAFCVCRSIFPDWFETVKVEEPKPEPEKKNPEQAAMEQERDQSLAEIRRLNDRIKDPVISAKIDRMEAATRHIYTVVMEKPEKKNDVRTFFHFYLPTTIKLLNEYDRLTSMGLSGENIDATKRRIEDMLESIAAAFEKQVDQLYRDEAMDISTDITVFRQMMQQQGLN